MALTAEERATLTGYLSEAKAALHKLMLGGSARVFVDQNGERVEFTAANRDSLKSYIADLESQLGITGKTPGPMQMWMI